MFERIKARITRRGAKAMGDSSLKNAIVDLDVLPKKPGKPQIARNILKNGKRKGGTLAQYDDDGVTRWNEVK